MLRPPPPLPTDSKFNEDGTRLLKELRARGIALVVLDTPDRGSGMVTSMNFEGIPDPRQRLEIMRKLAGALLVAGEQMLRDAEGLKRALAQMRSTD